MVGGACAGYLAVAIGHVFSFDLGFHGFHASLLSQFSDGAAIVGMQAGLGMVFGLMAATFLGAGHAVVEQRRRVLMALAWVLIGLSAGVICWVMVVTIDDRVGWWKPTEYVVWVLVWSAIGGIVGAQTAARRLRKT